MQCQTHPRYKAVQPPRDGCQECKDMYIQAKINKMKGGVLR